MQDANARLEGMLDGVLNKWAGAIGLDLTPPGDKPVPQAPPTALTDSWMRVNRVKQHAPAIGAVAARYGVPADVLHAMVDVESGGDHQHLGDETKHGRSAGLLRLMPGHFLPGEDPHDPETNLNRGAALLAHHQRRTGDWDQAAAHVAYGDKLTLRDRDGLDGYGYAQKIKTARSAYAT